MNHLLVALLEIIGVLLMISVAVFISSVAQIIARRASARREVGRIYRISTVNDALHDLRDEGAGGQKRNGLYRRARVAHKSSLILFGIAGVLLVLVMVSNAA